MDLQVAWKLLIVFLGFRAPASLANKGHRQPVCIQTQTTQQPELAHQQKSELVHKRRCGSLPPSFLPSFLFLAILLAKGRAITTDAGRTTTDNGSR